LADVGSTVESGRDLYGSFSPRVEASSTVVAPVLQIMPRLQKLCGELLVIPQSDEPAKVDSLVASVMASSPSQAPGFEESGDVDRARHVVSVDGVMSKKSGAAE
jgi:hypothetical protein